MSTMMKVKMTAQRIVVALMIVTVKVRRILLMTMMIYKQMVFAPVMIAIQVLSKHYRSILLYPFFIC